MNAVKTIYILLLVMLQALVAKSQGSKDSLVLDNGFNVIKLGTTWKAYNTLIDTVPVNDMGLKGKTYQVNRSQLTKISDLELTGALLVCFNDTIRKVTIIPDESIGADFFSSMIEKYGMPDVQNLRTGMYSWKTGKVQLLCEKTQSSYRVSFSDAQFYTRQAQ